MTIQLSVLIEAIKWLENNARHGEEDRLITFKGPTAAERFDIRFVRSREGKWTIPYPMAVEPD